MKNQTLTFFLGTFIYLALIPIHFVYGAQGDSETSIIATLSGIKVGMVSKTCLYPVREQGGAIAKSRTPDGQEFKFYAPRGLTDEALSIAAEHAYYRMREGIDLTLGPPGTFRKTISRLSDCPERIELIFNSLIVTDDVGSMFREK